MTAEQFIGEYVSVYGHMPPREELWHGIEGLSQHGAAAALKGYQQAHPEARRAPAGAKSKLSKSDRPAPAQGAHSTEWKETGDTATIEFKSFREIRNIEELLDAAGVDRDVWTAPTCTVNTWTMPGGADSDEPRIRLWQVKATLKRREDVQAIVAIRDEAIEQMAAHAPHYPPIARSPHTGGHLLVISPADAHIGKGAWAGETGQNMTIETAVQAVRESVEILTADALPLGISEIVLVIGNDFLQVDSPAGTTTKGTAVAMDGTYHQAVAAAKALTIELIERLMVHAPVHAVFIPGNHDRNTVISLGQYIHAWFRNAPEVTVDAEPTGRKYLSRGKVLLGFTHGDAERHAALPQIMAQEQPRAWAATTCREWLTGHFHRKSSQVFNPLTETGGVIVRTLSALSRADFWHHQHGYISTPAAEAFVYHPDRGLKAQFHHRPEAM